MRPVLFLLLTVCGVHAAGQTLINGSRTILGDWDASGAIRTLPMKTGTLAEMPASCAPGEFYFATNAPLSRRIHECRSGAFSPAGYLTGTTPPSACTKGELFFDTGASPPNDLLKCTATGDPGTWTALVPASGPGSSRQVLYTGLGTTIANNSSSYCGAGCGSTEANQAIKMPVSGSIGKIRVYISTTQPAGCTLTVRARIAGLDQSEAFTIAGDSTAGWYMQSSGATFSFNAEDTLSVRLQQSNCGSASATVRAVAAELVY